MQQLTQDIRAHPVASALLVGAWGAITLLVAGATIGACGFSLILGPSIASSWLIGRSRRERGAQSAALIIGIVLLSLTVALVAVTVGIDQHLQGDPKDGGGAGWAAFQGAILLALFADVVYALPGCVLAWFIGRTAYYREDTSATAG